MRNRFMCVGVVLALLAMAPVRMSGQQASFAPPASAAQTSSPQAGTAAVGAQPQYPGIGPTGDKLEAEMGAFKLRLYGTLLLNAAITTAPIVGQEVPLWTAPNTLTVTYPDGTVGPISGSQDLLVTMRQSVFGFTVNPAKPAANDWASSGLLEMDFFGPRAVDGTQPQNRTLTPPRMRLAYFQLERNGVRLVFGQDKAILAPLDPISLSHVAMPLGATAGDLWAWAPQVRVDVTRQMGGTSFLFQAGVLRPEFGETPPGAATAVDGTSSGSLGARSTQPFYQGRVAVSPLSDPLCPAGRGDKGTDPCQFQLQFLYQGEGALQLRLAAEGFKLGSKRKGALRAEVANGPLHAMCYPRRAFGVSHPKSVLDLG